MRLRNPVAQSQRVHVTAAKSDVERSADQNDKIEHVVNAPEQASR
jgi:hypothetical protein